MYDVHVHEDVNAA